MAGNPADTLPLDPETGVPRIGVDGTSTSKPSREADNLPKGLVELDSGDELSSWRFSAGAGEELPEGLVPAAPSFAERAMELGFGTAEGALTGYPAARGAIAGARLGATAGASLGPLGVLGGGTAGALLGGGAGYLLGEKAAETVVPSLSDPELRGYRAAGETFGQAIGAAPAAFALPVSSANRVSRFLSGIGEFARKNPKAYLSAEAIPSAWAGIAGGASEEYYPGEAGIRFAAETGAGALSMLSPARILTSSMGLISQGIKKGIGAVTGRGVSESAFEESAAKALRRLLKAGGEDVATVQRELRAPLQTKGLPGAEGKVTPTSAQKTGSPVLTAFENTLAKDSARFGGEVAKQGKEAFRAHRILLERLRQDGSPDALRQAAEVQENLFKGQLELSLQNADAAAAEAIAKMTQGLGTDAPTEIRAQIGQIVKTNTQNALDTAREVESSLWNKAVDTLRAKSFRNVIEPNKLTATRVPIVPSLRPSNSVNGFLEYVSSLSNEVLADVTPPLVKSIMAKFGVSPDAIKLYKAGKNSEGFATTGVVPDEFLPTAKNVSMSDVVSDRSALLKMARDAAGQGNSFANNFYSTLADGMLKDLEQVKNPALDEARSFSRSLNDVFTRTFARTASEGLDVAKTGAQRLPAEILVAKAFSGNIDVTSTRMAEIEDAVKFMSTKYDDAVQQFGVDSPQALALKPAAEVSRQGASSLADAHARVLQLAASSAIKRSFDPATGKEVTRLSVPELQRFVTEYRPMLDKLGLTGDLTDAVKAENMFRQVQTQNSALMQRAADQSAWADVLKAGMDRPSEAIGNILAGKNPIQGFKNLVQLAQTGGPAAVRGLRASLFDYAYEAASSAGGLSFSPRLYEKALFEPVALNRPSLARMFSESGAIPLAEIKRLRRAITAMVRIEDTMASRTVADNVLPAADAISELGQKVIGANVGSKIAPKGPGSLIVASAGSNAVRKLLDKLPSNATRLVLERAAKDPKFMDLLLERAVTPSEKLKLARSLHSYLGSAGLNYAAFEEPPPEPQTPQAAATFTAQGQAARALRALPAAPSTRGVSFTGGKAAPQSPPAGQGPSAAPGGARSALQSLFPFDTISSMFRGNAPPQ